MLKLLNEISIDTAHFCLKHNMNRKEISYFLPENYKEIKALIKKGAYVLESYKDGSLIAVAIVDFIENNNTVFVIGPFGSYDDLFEIINYLKEKYFNNRILISTSNENKILNLCEKIKDDVCMELLCKRASSFEGVDRIVNNMEFLNLHNLLFLNSNISGLELLKSHCVYGYYENEKLLGYIAYNKEDNYIDYIGVNELYRKKGIGNKLLNYCINDLKNNIVRVTVNADNYGAINLYKKNGFRITHHMICGVLKGE